MDIDKAIKEEKKRHEDTMRVIMLCTALCHLIDFVDIDRIFSKTLNVDAFKKALHEFKEKFGNYKLLHYYMSTNTSIAVVYEFSEKEVDVAMYCNEPEKILNEISNGKCKIVKRQFAKSEVVCEI